MALLTEESVPAEFKSACGCITIHGLMASFLASDHPQLTDYKTWTETWPSMEDFEQSMPMLWSKKFHTRVGRSGINSILPPAIRSSNTSMAPLDENMTSSLLYKQEANFDRDLAAIQNVSPRIDVEWYRYCWLIVNTRTFYYELPGLIEKRLNKDCMVMCPFLDLFNHADEGVSGDNFGVYESG